MGTLSRAWAKVCSLVMLCWTLAASAQTFTGTIVGRVVDSQQSVVAGASITLRSLERDFTRHTIANTQGEYAFELVPPGRFSVRAESSGFIPTAASVEVACTNFRKARQLDPLNSASVSNVAREVGSRWALAGIYEQEGRFAEAIAEYKRLDNNTCAEEASIHALSAWGRRKDAPRQG